MEMDNNIVEPNSVPEVSESTSEAVEASNPVQSQDDAVLDRLIGMHEETKGEPVEASSEVTTDDDALTKAVNALKRDGVPESVIAQMKDNDVENLTEWGNKAAKRQSEVDSYGSRLKALEEKQTPEGDTPAEASTEAVDPFADVEARYGADAAKPLRDMAEQMQSQMQQVQALTIQSELSRAESNMRSVFSDADFDREKITRSMSALAEQYPGRFESVEQMMFVACCQEYGEPNYSKVQQADLTPPPAKAQPTPVRSSGATPPAKRTLTGAERDEAVLDALMSGKDPEEVKAMFS